MLVLTAREAQGISLLAWFAPGIHPHLSRYNAPLKFRDLPGTEGSTRALAKKVLLDIFRIADEMLEQREVSSSLDGCCNAHA